MNYAFILNPASGNPKKTNHWIEHINRVCHEKQVDFVLWETERPGHGKLLAEEAVNKGFKCVVAVGGDGTINEIASTLLHSQTVLGIVPKGSGNGLAREFGISLSPPLACEMLLRSRPLAIDAGKINADYFFNVAGIGFDAQVSYAFNKSRRRGRLPYFTSGMMEYFSYKPPNVLISHDQEELRLTPFLVAIANGRQYGSGAIIAPKASVNDGLFHVVAVESADTRQLFWHLPKLFNGTLDQTAFVRTFSTKELSIILEKEMPYHIDGESRLEGIRLDVKILPLSLTVLVPPQYGYSET